MLPILLRNPPSTRRIAKACTRASPGLGTPRLTDMAPQRFGPTNPQDQKCPIWEENKKEIFKKIGTFFPNWTTSLIHQHLGHLGKVKSNTNELRKKRAQKSWHFYYFKCKSKSKNCIFMTQKHIISGHSKSS